MLQRSQTIGITINLGLTWRWSVTAPFVMARNLGRGWLRSRPAAPVVPMLARPPEDAIRLTWLGHSTTLIDIRGRRVLTDPLLRDRVLFSRRLAKLPVRAKDMRGVDLVLISHGHLDHLDRPSLRKLGTKPVVVVPPECGDLVDDLGFQEVIELEPGSRVSRAGFDILAMPVPHTKFRHPLSRARGVCAYVLTREGKSVLFIGDAARTEGESIGSLGLNLEAAILPISSYEPEWYRFAHMTPEEALDLFRGTRAKHLIPVHRETFILSLEPVEEPLVRLRRAAEAAGLADRLLVPRMGETVDVESGEELLEVVDGRGRTVSLELRSRCHKDPALAHRAVHVFVKNGRGEFFLQKRSMTKDIQPGRWDTSVGGHVAAGESYKQAAVRELAEELGVDASGPGKHGRLRPVHDYVWRSPVETEHVRTFLFHHEGPFTLHPEEIDDGRFWTPGELWSAVGTGVLTPNLEEELRRLHVVGREAER